MKLRSCFKGRYCGNRWIPTVLTPLLLVYLLAPAGGMAQTSPPSDAELEALAQAADQAAKVGNHVQAIELLQQIIPYRASDDQAVDLMYLGASQLAPELNLPPEVGELSLKRGIQQAEQLEHYCWASFGWRTLAERWLDRQDVDLDQVAELLDQADELALECDETTLDFADAGKHASARGLVELLRAELARHEGDQPGLFEALERALILLPPESNYRITAYFRLFELKHDLGDVTDDGAGYDALLEHPDINHDRNFVLRMNLHISRAALILDQEQRPADAVPHLDAVIRESLEQTGNESFVAVAYAYRCLVALREQKLDEASGYLEDMKAYTQQGLIERQEAFMDFVEGEVLLAQGDLAGAEALFHRVNYAGDIEPELRWRALEGLSRVALTRDTRLNRPSQEARALLVSAIEGLEAQRRLMASSFLVLAYTSQRQRLYDGLLELLVDQHLYASRDTTEVTAPPEGAGIERSVGSLTGTPDDLLALVEKRSAISLTATLLRDWGGLSDESRKRAALASPLVTGTLLSGPALRAQLPAGQPYYIFQPLKDRILVLTVTRDETVAHVVPFGPERRAVLKSVLPSLRAYPTDIPSELEHLGEWLLRDILPSLPGPDTPSAFVLLGELESLPLAGLRIDDQFLVERAAPYEVPSLLAAGLLPGPSSQTPLSTLGIAGTEDLEWALPQLELLERPGISLYPLESPASVQDTLSALQAQSFGLVVFATHATPPRRHKPTYGNGKPAGIQPREEAALVLGDGTLTPSRLDGLKLKGARVILSACETRRGDARFQEHSLGSLHRAFLTAGASSVVGTRWKISDGATFVLMALLLEELKLQSEAQARAGNAHPPTGMAVALARAQRRMLQGQLDTLSDEARRQIEAAASESLVPISAPSSWAAFSVVGRPE